MSAQDLFQSLVEFERDMSGLAAMSVTSGNSGDRQDVLARLAVAAEGCEHMVREILSYGEAVPFRDRFQTLLDVQQRRTRGLQEVILHGGAVTVAAMTTVSWLVDLTIDPIQHIIDGLKELAAADGVGRLIYWLTGGVRGEA